MNNVYIYILIMALVTFFIRALPMTVFRKEIKNKTVRSFLYYVPYVTLSVMTFPAIIHATGNITAGIAAFVIGIIAAFAGGNLIVVSAVSCLTVFAVEMIFR